MPATAKAPLDADEERVTRAQRLLIQLGAALVHRPFDTTTHDRLRTFLTDDAKDVLASLEILEQRPETELRQRIGELAGHCLFPAEGAA
ncbi:hypothetical protein OG883_41630 [Streptomyces sp. NBC_01142]|uniref:hypothetical protein n=1 Tax=Streptomyces sp. NBC_01142 TaxID=2975865 RepID=UPI00225C23E9|nr:hypothetical protein [Streptomyces sp. NBC_01142]MCX4826173.1 hypothetical protein [Streptomyces sp. NBC_01142]